MTVHLAPIRTRSEVLEAESRCPVCGAASLGFRSFGDTSGSAQARYACGAILSVFQNNPFVAMRTCPAPTRTALRHMEYERGETVE